MTIGTTLREKAVVAARKWRQIRFKTLRNQLVTSNGGEIRFPLVYPKNIPVSSLLTPSIMNIKIDTNNNKLLQWCQLEYFNFFYSKPETSSTEGDENNNIGVCIHVGPPNSLGYPYTLTAEVNNFTNAIRRSEEYTNWENTNDNSLIPHPTRWLTQPLLDGFISRRVSAHVGLTSGDMPHILKLSKRLKMELPPSEVSPYYFANELLTSWGIFGLTEPTKTELGNEDINRLIQLAHASSVLRMYPAIWLNGAALCNDKGEFVLILGPRKSGKTTLAMHCLASSFQLRLIGIENFHLAPGSSVINSNFNLDEKMTLIMGVPSSTEVGIGALIGTLRPNPRLAESAHTFNYSPTFIQNLLKNNEMSIWNMSSRYQIHINEAFGPQRWCPTLLGNLKGIILLNWDLQELSLKKANLNTDVLQWKKKSDCFQLLSTLAEEREKSLFKGHYLIRSIYDENNALKYLENSIFEGKEMEEAPIYEFRGSVNFDTAVKLICERLLKNDVPS